MEWRDEGILLSARAHGEGSAIVEVFTAEHGRHAGVVRGGASRKLAPMLQPGAQLDVVWRARLEEHIGSFKTEVLRSRAGNVIDNRLALAGLNAVTALLSFALPEREEHGALYRQTVGVLDLLGEPDIWPLAYLRWEMSLLEELGFGLDLAGCAVTGSQENLIYVSPKSGRAVSRQGAGEWADRLLPLPPVMLRKGDASDEEIAEALETTGFFLREHMAPMMGNRPLPEARDRFITAFMRQI
ncbi:DNA repair protein RecO [Aliishimia ponticola]|uniref:DNA repair protein RecO n=1 Tax=Aliishimia ponticola TaxID=2499833 RepID=A0A4S4N7C7_9RHOB|nr:DNA repair protein RecO [Aliishimia ponticola]THH35046.1 DNA repair protein RecO [Aliishimia ponticola]